MKLLMGRGRYLTLGILIFANVFIWLAIKQERPRNYVSVSFLDVGQGDAILIEGKTGNQILIDGGPNKTVLRMISQELSYFDRSIDVVMETHPDKDHIGGFPYILERYTVKQFIEPGVESENGIDDEIRRIRLKKHIDSTLARSGTIIDFHDGSYLRILFPDTDVSQWETNNASIVAQYVYGDTCFLLTGDSPISVEEYLVLQYEKALHCQVLKLGHHGSRTSTSQQYLDVVQPEIAIVSAGKGNSYGHPHPEVIDMLAKQRVSIQSTGEKGTITIYSDGNRIWNK